MGEQPLHVTFVPFRRIGRSTRICTSSSLWGASVTSGDLQLVVVDDDPVVRASVQTLEGAGFRVACFQSAEQALQHVGPDFRGVVICEVRRPGMDGFMLLKQLKVCAPAVPVILMTGHGDVSTAVKAMRCGAFDFIEKPCAAALLVDAARRAAEHCRLRGEVEHLRKQVTCLAGPDSVLVGTSPAMQKLRAQIANIADTSADVLLFGETGTGKELVARTLHELSSRREENFVALNCGGLPESLFESEIFGHEAGAFTGATKRRIGKIEHADGGTLLLDEIETMPLLLQTKFLRVLQERRVERLGSNQELPVDVRLVAATKSDLRALSTQGGFRSDLYYRLDVVVIHLPPLRDRLEDIPALLMHFMLDASRRHGRLVPELSGSQMRNLMLHHWPGNVRELRNVAERFVLGLEEADTGSTAEMEWESGSLFHKIDQFERALLQHELKRHNGCTQATMNALRLPKRTFYDKMHKHGIRPDTFRVQFHN